MWLILVLSLGSAAFILYMCQDTRHELFVMDLILQALIEIVFDFVLLFSCCQTAPMWITTWIHAHWSKKKLRIVQKNDEQLVIITTTNDEMRIKPCKIKINKLLCICSQLCMRVLMNSFKCRWLLNSTLSPCEQRATLIPQCFWLLNFYSLIHAVATSKYITATLQVVDLHSVSLTNSAP